ncbi:protein PTST, chloroplastic [Syzygium oleosum]|uniref:protein PTST, chloroplastic n=1 Tax=Syzygium oleosum TaxID=219896 RepID=UPI0011D2713E|nr:protein PTST, chloroplastic [Syzygium oleosum]
MELAHSSPSLCHTRYLSAEKSFIRFDREALQELKLPSKANSQGSCSMEMSTARCCLDKQVFHLSSKARTPDWESTKRTSHTVTSISQMVNQSTSYYPASSLKMCYKHLTQWRTFSTPVSIEESFPSQSGDDYIDEEDSPEDSPENLLSKPLSSEELKALLADTERARLIRKLSEANQQNRFLKRQLHVKEDALVTFKSELAVMELEVQALVALAEEIAKSETPVGTRKINGKYVQSHLLSRLEAIREKLKEKTKDVDAARSKEVPLFWYGMAESVQVMGTFDGWSQGEHLSPEYTGSFTKFSTTLMLRPGRYEIKFLVDGEWQISPEFPTIGEGLTKNNLLIVE